MTHVAVEILAEVLRSVVIALPAVVAYRWGCRAERDRCRRVMEQEIARIREKYGFR